MTTDTSFLGLPPDIERRYEALLSRTAELRQHLVGIVAQDPGAFTGRAQLTELDRIASRFTETVLTFTLGGPTPSHTLALFLEQYNRELTDLECAAPQFKTPLEIEAARKQREQSVAAHNWERHVDQTQKEIAAGAIQRAKFSGRAGQG